MIRIKSPGRICLFGEHQDYLGYPIIAMSISKYIYLKAVKTSQSKFIINLPDIKENIEIPLHNKEVEYFAKRDYLRSGYNIFIRNGIRLDKGYRIEITGDIPINSGVASSSALVIAWLFFLNIISGNKLNLYQLAIEGYNTEVKEFKEGGGIMDHFCSVYGDLIFLNPFLPKPNLINYNLNLDGFILGNSLENKATVDDLIRVKNLAKSAFNELSNIMPDFNPYTTTLNELDPFLSNLKKEHQLKIIGNIINRDITIEAKLLIDNNKENLLRKSDSNLILNFYQKLGKLLNLHHFQLKENIQVSTKKIDKMIFNCLRSGAFGGKINGSGFGGTMFILFPGNEQLVKQIIEDSGGEAYIIKTSKGVKFY
ncbi:MAG: mevalonate kinase [Candidatus Hodarchaeota archaeon]